MSIYYYIKINVEVYKVHTSHQQTPKQVDAMAAASLLRSFLIFFI